MFQADASARRPRYRRSVVASVLAHVFVLILLPWLWGVRGCVEPYLVPWGSGAAAVAQVRVVHKHRPEKRKRYVLRPDSRIVWQTPDLEESRLLEQLDQDSSLTYQANVAAVHGAMGAGGGKQGGWPDGVPGGVLRFIRLQHGGADWDDGMDSVSRADANFLDYMRKEVPFQVARKGEAHTIRLLAKYPRGYAPPFVFLTGEGPLGGVSGADAATIRDYCLAGGMLFADAGDGRFDSSFRQLLARVFPDKRLVAIADDDPIFQMPYIFPNGAPALWHHGGRQTWGIKHQGRWCVFYHPGDLNDAWKTGHSGLEPRLAEASYQLGANVVFYAVTHYLEQTRKLRK